MNTEAFVKLVVAALRSLPPKRKPKLEFELRNVLKELKNV